MSLGYKSWFQFEQHYNHSVFNFYFFGKKKKNSPANVLKLGLNSARWMLACVAAEHVTKSLDYTGGFVCLRCQSWWASTLVTISAHYDWSVGQLTPFHSQESYLTTGMLPYKHSRFFPQYARLYNAATSPALYLHSAGLVGKNVEQKHL